MTSPIRSRQEIQREKELERLLKGQIAENNANKEDLPTWLGVLIGILGVIFLSWICLNERKQKHIEQKSWSQWEHDMVPVSGELFKIGSSILYMDTLGKDQVLTGGWLVVNQAGWRLSEENKHVVKEKLPKHPSEIAYVVIVSPARKKSLGFWKRPGPRMAHEKFTSEYTIYLIDWKHKSLISREELRSQYHDVWGSYEENQNEARTTILTWLSKHGVVAH